MDKILYFIITFSILLFLCVKKMNFFSPLLLTYMVWTIIPLLYEILPTELYKLSEDFYFVIFSFVVFFSAGYFFYKLIIFDYEKKNTKDYIFEISRKKEDKIYHFCTFVVSYLLFRFFMILLTGNNIYRMSIENGYPADIKLFLYLDRFCIAYFVYLLLKINSTKKEKYYVTLYILYYIMKLGKMYVMQLFIIIVYILYIKGKLKFRYLLWGGIFVYAILVFTNFSRTSQHNNDQSFLEAIYEMMMIYFLSPLKAFDMLILGDVSLPHGRTFSFLYKVLLKLFGINLISAGNGFDGWVFVPFRTNVYTALLPFYSDYGLVGVILFGTLEGFLWSFLYEHRKHPWGKIVFIINIYILVFQFFSDMIFDFMSTIIQIIVCSYIFCRMGKIQKKEILCE